LTNGAAVLLNSRMRSVLNFSTILGILMLATTPALAGPDCTCRYQGGDIAEGGTACIRAPQGMTLARCEKVLNNTSWKFLNVPCPSARANDAPAGPKAS
jgi:hypothetical protein